MISRYLKLMNGIKKLHYHILPQLMNKIGIKQIVRYNKWRKKNMPSEKQIKNQSKQVKRLMKEQHYFFIRNNEKFRKKLEMNRRQLSFTLNYLNRTGFLKPWSHKIYQIMHN